jgi:hypothetical protein
MGLVREFPGSEVEWGEVGCLEDGFGEEEDAPRLALPLPAPPRHDWELEKPSTAD